MPLTLPHRFWTFIIRLIASRRSQPEPILALPTPTSFAPDINPDEYLEIPICESGSDEETRNTYLEHGRFLARQERWEDLSNDMRRAEATEQTTPGGMPVADLLALGARADVVMAAEHALQDGAMSDAAPVSGGVTALEALLEEYPGDYAIALVVALAHVDLGWAWRGDGWDATVPVPKRARFHDHFKTAERILEPYCGIELSSPSLAAARCALLASHPDPRDRIVDDYEDLIDLAPRNHRHMRKLGNQLLPRWFGTYDQLELEARRTAARTQDIWGAGGYTWVCSDAIALDEEACSRMDVDYFIEGLHDIVKTRPDQYMINLLTAYCAVTMQQRIGFDESADFVRNRISECSGWLIRDHLTEVHPVIWANAAEGSEANTRVTSLRRFLARGRTDALNTICDQFAEDILRGNRVRFTPDGPELLRV